MTVEPIDLTPRPGLRSVLTRSEHRPGSAHLLIFAGLAIAIAQFVAFPRDVASPEGWLQLLALGLIGAGAAIRLVPARVAPAPVLPPPQIVEAGPAAVGPPGPQPMARSAVIRTATDRIVADLKPFAGTCFDGALAALGGEHTDVWWGLKTALVNAEWRQVTWRESSDAEPRRSRPATVAATNIEIHIHPDSRGTLLPVATALAATLGEAGIAADVGFDCRNGNADAIHILIGDERRF